MPKPGVQSPPSRTRAVRRAVAPIPVARDEGADIEVASTSVARVVRVLEAFSEEEPQLSFTELRRRLGIAPTTLQRVLGSLEDTGYLVRGDDSRKYRLGLALVARSRIALNIHGIRTEFGVDVAELAKQTNCNANLAVLQNGLCYLLTRVAKPGFPDVRAHAGQAYPPQCTALGQALLGWADELDFAEAMKRVDWSAGAPTAPHDAVSLDRQLALVRGAGYAVDRGDWNVDVVAIAAPIRDASGRAIAAIGVSDLRAQVAAAREKTLGAAVTEAARRASIRRGYDPYQ